LRGEFRASVRVKFGEEMLMDKGSLNCGGRRGRPFAMSTGNPVIDMASAGVVNMTTPNRVKTSALPIAIPDSNGGSRKRNGSPRSVQSGTSSKLIQSHSCQQTFCWPFRKPSVAFIQLIKVQP
jgi:hypothetical protein